MGLFDFLKKQDDSKKSEEDLILEGAEDSSVLVPDHVKTGAKKSEEVLLMQKTKQINNFKVSGLYNTGSLTMISGLVQTGKLKKKMKAKFDGKEMAIVDIKIGSTSVEELILAEEGSIFVKSKGMPQIRYGDILEFK
jgi:hypothetical protein